LQSRRATVGLWIVAGVFATTLGTSLLFQRGENNDVAVYLRQVQDVRQSFAMRYGTVQPTYRELQSSPRAAREHLPGLRRTALTLTGLRERAQGFQPPARATDLHRRLIAYFREQELVAHDLAAATAVVVAIQASHAAVGRAGELLRPDLRGEAGRTAAAKYAERLEAQAADLSRLEPVAEVDPGLRAHVEWLGAQATAVRQAPGMRELEGTVRDVDAASAAFTAEATEQSQLQAMLSYSNRVRRSRQLGAAVEQQRHELESLD
jgi:hypothetical protein